MNIPKESAMLLDIQYIKARRREGIPDYLYVIWKDLDTGEKHLETIKEPMMTIYFEKDELRNHTHPKNYERLENLNPCSCKYKDIIYRIADDMGDIGRQRLNNYFNTANYSGLDEFYLHPYSFGADYDIRTWYRYKWIESLDNSRDKVITKGFLDIEVDTLEAVGMPDPVYNPIDLVTLIDTSTNISYTFALIGVDYKAPSYLNTMSDKGLNQEELKKKMYANRIERQYYYTDHLDELEKEAHAMFDESYDGMQYKFFFYEDERKMLVHLFQLINKLKLDFIGVWNISFDIPYILNRLEILGLNPIDVICPSDFPSKEAWFKKDQKNFNVKNKSDFFHVTSYTVFFDQMIVYAAIRKGQSELRSNKLTYIAKKEIGDEKLDYSENGNIKTLSYNNYLMYILYNIKDVLLQTGIEEKTSDVENYYMTSYANLTPYEDEYKQTKRLRNVQYKSFLEQKLVPGNNTNSILYNKTQKEKIEKIKNNEEIDDDEEGFEGALVGDPTLIDNFGEEIFGKKSNSLFNYSVDFDMGAFYPSTIRVMNIDPSTLIFKMIMKADQFNIRGGSLKYNGITDVQLNPHNSDSFVDDVAKEFMDNFQTRNYLSFGIKWLNMPDVNEVYEAIKKRL